MTLHAIKSEPTPEDELGALMRAKERAALAYEAEQRQRIAKRDWAALHVRGDRSPPMYLPERTGRGWRG